MHPKMRTTRTRKATLLGLIVLVTVAVWYFASRSHPWATNPASGGALFSEREPYTAAHRSLYTPRDHYTADFNAFMTRLHNELERQPEAWSEADARFVADYIGLFEHVPPGIVWEDGKCTMQEIEILRMSNDAASIASDRILKGGNISPEALVILDKATAAMLDAKNSDSRNAAVASTYEAGLWHYDKSVRAKIERMKDADPASSVRTNIENRLLNFDRMWKNIGPNWEYVRGPRE